MKKLYHNLIVLAGIVAVLASCQKEPCRKCMETQERMEQMKNRIELRVEASPATKVADAVARNESAIHSAILFVFDAQTGIILSKHRDSTGCFILTLADGTYDFATIVNAPDVQPSSVSELCLSVSALSANKANSFVMFGLERGVDIVSSRTIPVTVRRLVSKVNYSITVDLENPANTGLEFIVKGAYMTNVCGDAAYGSSTYKTDIWYNRMYYCASDLPNLLFGNETCALRNGDRMTSVHTFYVYPNGYEDDHDKTAFSPRCTRLIVETRIDGETYYYPVTLPDIKPNTAYDVNLKVKGPGMRHPEDENISAGSIEVVVGVSEWETGENINAEF